MNQDSQPEEVRPKEGTMIPEAPSPEESKAAYLGQDQSSSLGETLEKPEESGATPPAEQASVGQGEGRRKRKKG